MTYSVTDFEVLSPASLYHIRTDALYTGQVSIVERLAAIF